MSFTKEQLGVMRAAIAPLLAAHGDGPLARTLECLDRAAGLRAAKSAHPLQRPRLMHFPGLTAKPWHDPAEHEETRAVCALLERSSPELREEALRLVEAAQLEGLATYLDADFLKEKFQGVREEQWRAVHFRDHPSYREENRLRFPRTAALVDALSPRLMAHGEAFFSVLAPRTEIPPHHDECNYKLTVHLPLVIPQDCGIEVGGEARVWQEGKCLLFDDTFRHTAWNRSPQARICLLLDVWNPELTTVERQALGAINRAILEGA